MAERLADGEVRRVKESIDLVELIGDYTQVQRVGSAFKACCPFHQERTPSFYIYQEDQHYHCFGCGAHGDAISLVQELDQMEFIESIEHLARRAGIALRYETYDGEPGKSPQERRTERERQTNAMSWATSMYEAWLWSDVGREARAYLTERGLDEATIRAFHLGWAPGGGSLVAAATKRRADVSLLETVNLALKRDYDYLDRFYERIMFPIFNRQGHPVAFSGRLLPEAERAAKEAGRGVGKYINSTDTPLYNKGSIVFNLHRARKHVRERKRLIVMEGPTDVMAAEQAGVPECVAVLGTALTEEHARQLGRQVGSEGRLILLFDGDQAGQTNSCKAVRITMTTGMTSWVAVMPGGQDPSELLASPGGNEQFEQILAGARPDMRYLISKEAVGYRDLEPRRQIAIIDSLLEPIRKLADRDLRALYLGEIHRSLDVSLERLRERLGAGPAPVESPEQAAADVAAIGIPGVVDALLHILVRCPDLRGDILDDAGIEPAMIPEPWRCIVDALIAEPDAVVKDLVDAEAIARHPRVRDRLYHYMRTDVLRSGRPISEAASDYPALVPTLIATWQEREQGAVRDSLKEAAASANDADALAALKRMRALAAGEQAPGQQRPPSSSA